MATVNVKLDKFNADLNKILDALKNDDRFLRPIAVELVGIMTERIHNNGLASDGSLIGTYKDSYLATRARHNAPRSNNVILILTNQLFQSWNAFATDKGWAVGFNDTGGGDNVSSMQKIKYAEERFGKKISDLTKEEQEYVDLRIVEIAEELISEAYATF